MCSHVFQDTSKECEGILMEDCVSGTEGCRLGLLAKCGLSRVVWGVRLLPLHGSARWVVAVETWWSGGLVFHDLWFRCLAFGDCVGLAVAGCARLESACVWFLVAWRGDWTDLLVTVFGTEGTRCLEHCSENQLSTRSIQD